MKGALNNLSNQFQDGMKLLIFIKSMTNFQSCIQNQNLNFRCHLYCLFVCLKMFGYEESGSLMMVMMKIRMRIIMMMVMMIIRMMIKFGVEQLGS